MPSPYLINRPEMSESSDIRSDEDVSSGNTVYLSEQLLQDVRMLNPSSNLVHSTQEKESNKRIEKWHPLQNISRRFWLWEFAACIFSLTCLASICGILLYENGRRLDQWRLSIPPNAIVSFIAMLAKGSLVLVLSQVLSQLKWIGLGSAQRLNYLRKFDSASRGPLGSLVLLCTSKHFLASLAALLMLLSLLVDPFVQIVFSFPSEVVTDLAQQSTFSSCSVFDSPLRQDVLTAKTTISIDDGLADAPFTEAFTCPSGNCLWPDDIKTLGLCGSCQTVTTGLQRKCITHTHSHKYAHDDDVRRIMTNCTYTFPSGGTGDVSGWIVSDTQDPNGPNFDFTTWNSTSTSLISESLTSLTIPTQDNGQATNWTVYEYTFGGFQVLRNPEVNVSMINNHTPFPIDLIHAQGYECGFKWCEKTYSNVRVVDGILSYTSTKETLWGVNTNYDLNSWFLFHPNQADEFQKLNSIYKVSYKLRDLSTLENFLNNLFRFDSAPSPTQSLLERQSDLNAAMNKLGDSLTEMIRTINGTAVLGQTQVLVPFIRVRWGWLALPLALLVITSTLLAVVAFRSHSGKTAVWKEDPLALLFHHIDGVNPSLLSKAVDPGPTDIENLANEIVVKMSADTPYTFVMSSLDKKEKKK